MMMSALLRIGLGGIAIECCTFSPLLTRYDDFAVHRGDKLIARLAPITGADGVLFAPTLLASATPGGPVASDAYEALKSEFLDGLRDSLPLDGLYLSMHGAMYVEGMEDAEADWICAAREVVGPDCVISASYDLHGNLSPAVVDALDVVTAYRTAPHEDMVETRARAMDLLLCCLRMGKRPHKALAVIPVLLPGERVMTTQEPAKGLYGQIPAVIAAHRLLDVSILVGYAWADEPRVAATVVALGEEAEAAQAAADALAAEFWARRAQFTLGAPTGDVDACIRVALASDDSPFFISDSGDNITAGAVGDSPHVLGRLLAHDVPDAVVAPLIDAAATAACFDAGVGAEVALAVGAGLDPSHGTPLLVRGRVMRLVNRNAAGRQALLRVGGVDVALCEQRVAFTEVDQFRALGIEPSTRRIIVVKLGYLFPELMSIARGACLAFSPGVVPLNVETLPYRRVRRPIYPLDEM